MINFFNAFAQDSATAASPTSGLAGLVPMLLIFVVFYFLLIRPQQKKMKEHKELINSIHRGDKVVTAGGIVGTVTKVEEGDDLVQVEIADNVKVKVKKFTITEVLNRPQPAGNDNKKAA